MFSSIATITSEAWTNQPPKNVNTYLHTYLLSSKTMRGSLFPLLPLGRFRHQVFIFGGWKCMPCCFRGLGEHVEWVQCPRVQVGTKERTKRQPFVAFKIPNRSNSLRIWDLRLEVAMSFSFFFQWLDPCNVPDCHDQAATSKAESSAQPLVSA